MMKELGPGIGWRAPLAKAIEKYPLGFVEIVVEDFPGPHIPASLERLMARGVQIIPHATTLSLGSAELPETSRLKELARLAGLFQAPMVSEHLAFVRGGGIETGHLQPLPRTKEMVKIVVENIRFAQEQLPVPLAVENIASFLEWPNNEMDEATFLTEIVEGADAPLLLDVANVYANCQNNQGDPQQFFERLPLHRIAYVHIAGGLERDHIYHDTHTRRTPRPVIDLLEELVAMQKVPGVMLERDDSFPGEAELFAELDEIQGAVQRGNLRREALYVA